MKEGKRNGGKRQKDVEQARRRVSIQRERERDANLWCSYFLFAVTTGGGSDCGENKPGDGGLQLGTACLFGLGIMPLDRTHTSLNCTPSHSCPPVSGAVMPDTASLPPRAQWGPLMATHCIPKGFYGPCCPTAVTSKCLINWKLKTMFSLYMVTLSLPLCLSFPPSSHFSPLYVISNKSVMN